jgi:drug/metabolite transporter (DMT)-like permease
VVLVVIIGLACAVVYGAGDFFGGIASRRVPPERVVAVAGVLGLALMLVVSLFIGGRMSAGAVQWGLLSGVAGSFAILTLYAALAIGPMSILSPLTAILQAVVPLTWSALQGHQLSTLAWIALGIALVAVLLVGFVPEKGAVRPKLRGIVYGSIAGVLLGVLLILLDQAPDDSGLLPLVFNRISYLTILWTLVLVLWLLAKRRGAQPAAPVRSVIWWIVAAGIADVLANTLLIIGLRLGELSIIAVLGALYPAGTIALAAIVLRERIAPVQWVGLGLALVASALLAVA